MGREQIKAIIEEDGSVHFELEGYQGQTCFAEYKKLEDIMKKNGVEAKTEKIVPTQPAPIKRAVKISA